MGGQHQGMDRPGVCQVPEGGGEQGKMEESGCEIIFGALTTLAVKGLMMTMKMIDKSTEWSTIPACPCLMCFFNRDDTDGTTSSNILCLMFEYDFHVNLCQD